MATPNKKMAIQFKFLNNEDLSLIYKYPAMCPSPHSPQFDWPLDTTTLFIGSIRHLKWKKIPCAIVNL